MKQIRRREFMAIAGGAGLAALTACTQVRMGLSSPGVSQNQGHEAASSRPIALNSNENPLGPSKSAVEAGVKAVANSSHRYAIEQRDDLVMDLVRFHGLNPGQILLGCGAIELLKITADVFCSRGTPPIISDPVYEAIEYYAGLRVINPIKVPAGSHQNGHDLDAMLKAVRARGGMVYVCNPCNPTGGVLGKRDLNAFIRDVPGDAVILVDEAYAEYLGPEFFSCLDLVRSGIPNLLVIRTFSKVYGLAGLRVGYCAGDRRLINAMAGHRLWNNINQAGAAAAREALKDSRWSERVRRENEKTRETFCMGLEKAGIEFFPSKANYVLLSVGKPWEEIHGYLWTKGILGGRRIPSMPQHIRISIGSNDEMAYCLNVLEELKRS
jgi:histidinol-phosphate aminotransferase